MRAGTAEGLSRAQGLSPSCSSCSSKLGAARGCCGTLHWYPPRVQNPIALGIHQDAPGIQHQYAPEPFPPSKLLLTHCTSTPLPQASTAPLHLKRAKQGQHPVPGMGGLQEPPAATRPGQGGSRRMP